MKIKIKRIDKKMPLPGYETPGAAAFDLAVREETEIASGQTKLIPLNIVAKLPAGYFGLLLARSSLHKMGLLQANGAGVIDNDYCGDEDEIKMPVLNFLSKKVIIEKGTRIGQLIVLKYEQAGFEEVENMDEENRGGFGSTGR